MSTFLSGFASIGFRFADYLLVRIWQRARNFFFAAAGLAFLLFATSQILEIAFTNTSADLAIELLRLCGAALILLAIVGNKRK